MMFSLNFSDLWLDGAEYLKSNLTSKISSILALFAVIVVAVYRRRRGLGTPRLQGPRSESFIFGKSKTVFPSTKLSVVYRDWERTYGPVYEIPTGFGSKEVILGDLKALIHLFSKDTTTYYQPARVKAVTRKTLGDILIMTEGETHKKLRRNLSHPLSVSAIRNLTRMCLDSAYQLKAGWDSRFQPSNDAVVINIEKGMSHVALDSAGKAILSHDFGALRGKKSPLLAEVDAFHAVKPSPFIRLVFFTVEKLYSLFNVSLPNTTERQFKELATLFKALTTDFLAKAREAPEDSDVHQSVLGVFLRSENADSKIRLSLHEIMTQSGLVLAASDTTTIALKCSLIELARRPEIQETLRTELGKCLTEGEFPTYDQLTKDLKYLDAFVCETLRLHTPHTQLIRVAVEDDVIPLVEPIRIASGAMIDSLFVKKGTVIRVPLAGVNISEALWGPEADMFDPGRWLDDEGNKIKATKEKIPGYRNLLTFGSGPRMCPGRDLAILELKVVLSVLVQHFGFEFPNGPTTEVKWEFGHPKVACEDGIKVPILVRRVV